MKNQFTEIEKDNIKAFKIEGSNEYIVSKCYQIINQLKGTKQEVKETKKVESKHEPKEKQGTTKVTQLIGVQGLADENKYTGIKEDSDGKVRYQLRYECEKCGEKGKHFVPEHTPFVNCHNCNNEMKVKKVETDYHIEKDTFNNYYYAGNYAPKLY